jgi:lipopolysaccharide transport system ATP-binding protein
MSTVIEVSQIGKRYRLGVDATGYDTLRDALRRAVRLDRRRTLDLWALRDVSFSVEHGEALGVIGSNGAGKTTLLKLLAGVTEPSSGEARVRGRVGALLDVGTGFHPELTGRENIYLSGAILGLRRSDVRRRFDEMVDFSGVGRFLDTPVKRYSAGMRLRLAFAVASHIEPPITVVDEILAVGDAAFREKCLGKLAEIGAHDRTVLFVSHDFRALTQFCSRAIWLESGRLREDGPAQQVVSAYLRSSLGSLLAAEFAEDDGAAVSLVAASVRDRAGRVVSGATRDEPLTIHFRLVVREAAPGLDVGVFVINEEGVHVIADSFSDLSREGPLPGHPGAYEASVTIPPILTPGRYRVQTWIGTEHDAFVRRELFTLEVTPKSEDPPGWKDRRRVVQPRLAWRISRTAPGP